MDNGMNTWRSSTGASFRKEKGNVSGCCKELDGSKSSDRSKATLTQGKVLVKGKFSPKIHKKCLHFPESVV
jgi:hypothetical protein